MNNAFDFKHLGGVCRGIQIITERFVRPESKPPPKHIQLVTGTATTLLGLVNMAIELAGTKARIHHAPPRDFNVSVFQSDPTRARQELAWTSSIGVREGLKRLIHAFRQQMKVT